MLRLHKHLEGLQVSGTGESTDRSKLVVAQGQQQGGGAVTLLMDREVTECSETDLVTIAQL